MIWRTILLWLIYTGLGLLLVKSALERRAAAQLWREANGGPFDFKQKKFTTELELDRAKLPPAAARELQHARRDLGFALMLLPLALTIQTLTLEG
jgi:hypothetical protein